MSMAVVAPKKRMAGNPSIVRQLLTGAAITGGSMMLGTDPITAVGQGIGGVALGNAMRERAVSAGNAAESAYMQNIRKDGRAPEQKELDLAPNVNTSARNMVGGIATAAGAIGGGLAGGLVNGVTNSIITSTGSSSNNQVLDPATQQAEIQRLQRQIQQAQQEQQVATYYLQSLGVLQ